MQLDQRNTGGGEGRTCSTSGVVRDQKREHFSRRGVGVEEDISLSDRPYGEKSDRWGLQGWRGRG